MSSARGRVARCVRGTAPRPGRACSDSEALHLTLCFLGNRPVAEIEALAGALERLRGARLRRSCPSARRCGCRRGARARWRSRSATSGEELARLQAALSSALARCERLAAGAAALPGARHGGARARPRAGARPHARCRPRRSCASRAAAVALYRSLAGAGGRLLRVHRDLRAGARSAGLRQSRGAAQDSLGGVFAEQFGCRRARGSAPDRLRTSVRCRRRTRRAAVREHGGGAVFAGRLAGARPADRAFAAGAVAAEGFAAALHGRAAASARRRSPSAPGVAPSSQEGSLSSAQLKEPLAPRSGARSVFAARRGGGA